MSWRRLLHVVAAVVVLVGMSMIVPAVVSIVYGEWSDVVPLLLAAAVTIGVGLAVRKLLGEPEELSVKEAFAAVGLAWTVVGALGALPYLLTGSFSSVTDAVFESVSGFTATGASVVANPAVLSHGILFWRALTQWLGGMGVVLLVIALLPLLGVGPLRLGAAESPGPTPERVAPRFQETARLLWSIFAVFTLAEALLLWLGDMTPFEAITHSFTTLSGGGFSTEAGSLGAFSAYSQWVVIVFMLIGGTSFALHYRGLRNPVQYVRNAEFRIYMIVVAAASGFMVIGTWGPSLADTVRNAVFTASSILTTTGFVTADYGRWIAPLHVLIVGLMFVGAMAGSTSGSIKVYRLEIIYGEMGAFFRRLIHRRAVVVVRSGGQPVSPVVVESVRTFFLLYVFAFFGGTLALGLVSALASVELGVPTIASAVASSLGNIGPGLEMVGPSDTYVMVPAAGKWLLALLMVVGRLEILPLVILLSREAWRR